MLNREANKLSRCNISDKSFESYFVGSPYNIYTAEFSFTNSKDRNDFSNRFATELKELYTIKTNDKS